MRLTLRLCALALCMLSIGVPRALAGGLEYTGQGSESLARGGAVAARAEDPMVLANNPAGLVELRGSQFLFNLNLALMSACVDPAGYYGWGVYDGGSPSRFVDPKTGKAETLQLGDPTDPKAAAYYKDPYDTVCLNESRVPIPQIAWTRRVSEDFGIGFGVIFPAIQPSGSWGGRDGVIRGASGDLRPAATRYMQLSSNNLGLFPTLGAAYRISQMLRVGLAVEWGIVAANNYSMATLQGGTRPNYDIIAHVKAQDWFVPAFTASVHVVPTDSVDVVAAFRYQDDVNAKGDIDLTTGVFDPRYKPITSGGLPILNLHQAMPWKLRAGVRYASRLAPRPAGTGRSEADPASPEVVHDPLQDERWDIELDAEYQANGGNQAQELTYPPGLSLKDPSGGNGTNIAYPLQDHLKTTIEKHWNDQVSLRIGSTLNLVPGRFGVSAGAHFENRGVDPSYMQVDVWPLMRLGLHTGVIVRANKSVDFVLSYAHIFQETLVVAPPEHAAASAIDAARVNPWDPSTNIDKTAGVASRSGPPPPVLEAPSQGTSDGTAKLNAQGTMSAKGFPPYVINAGRYRSHFDVVSVGVNVHF